MNQVLIISLVAFFGILGGWAWSWYRIGRRHGEDVTGDRWQQGYAAGYRVGWYDAADRLNKDANVLRRQSANGDWVDGWEDASRRLNVYWDRQDEGDINAAYPLEGYQTHT